MNLPRMHAIHKNINWLNSKCYNDKLNGKYIAERLLYWAFGLEKSKL